MKEKLQKSAFVAHVWPNRHKLDMALCQVVSSSSHLSLLDLASKLFVFLYL